MLTVFTSVVLGDFEHPVPAAKIEDKFRALLSASLGEDRAREVVRLVDRADALKDVRELTALLAPAS